ncbi:hypothetical protein I4U23_019954 [Adineta vaga]|nr:hypothetical protein I4U23_019954 [Adineta vaga]
MPAAVDIEFILRSIDEAYHTWQEKFQTTTNELPAAIQVLFCDCTQTLFQLSISNDDSEQTQIDQLNAELIISKLKELRQSLGNRWPETINSFGRDIFNVDTYRVEAAEYFLPVPFYPDDDTILKFYRWSVYDMNDTIVCRYFLEKSELMPGQPYFVLGKSYPTGHAQIQPYGSVKPTYNQMKVYIIDNLKGQGSPPIASSILPSFTTT